MTRYAVGSAPRFIAAGEGAVWVLDQNDGTVTRINPATGKVTQIATDSAGQGGAIAAGLGSVWLTVPGKPLTQIDARTSKVKAQYVGEGETA